MSKLEPWTVKEQSSKRKVLNREVEFRDIQIPLVSTKE